jgi:hypothetical protein
MIILAMGKRSSLVCHTINNEEKVLCHWHLNCMISIFAAGKHSSLICRIFNDEEKLAPGWNGVAGGVRYFGDSESCRLGDWSTRGFRTVRGLEDIKIIIIIIINNNKNKLLSLSVNVS